MHDGMAVGVGEGNVPEELVVRRFSVSAVPVRRCVVEGVAGHHGASVHVCGQDEWVVQDPSHHGSAISIFDISVNLPMRRQDRT